MQCSFCSKHLLHELGCTVTRRPLYWCCNCGTLYTCDGVTMTPCISQQHQDRVDKVTRAVLDSRKP